MKETWSQLSENLQVNGGDKHLKSDYNFQLRNLYITNFDNMLQCIKMTYYNFL